MDIRWLLPFTLLIACEGPAGPAGPAGEAGEAGDPADRDVQWVSFEGADDTDEGALADRVLPFTKEADDTWIRVTYHDVFSAYVGGSGACLCTWEVEFGGESCDDPGAAELVVASVVTQQMQSGTLEAWCGDAGGALTAGEYDLSVHVSEQGGCDCTTGWDGTVGLLEAEELF